jgi:hypothetical protein
MNIQRILATASLLGLAWLAPGIMAQEPTVLLLDKVNTDTRSDLPNTGMLMQQVREVYGEPEQVQGPVGEPPITTWRYTAFSVYFENNHAINSVRHFSRSDEQDG